MIHIISGGPLFLKNKRLYPLYWIVLSAIVLTIDYATGPVVEFPIVFVVPVILSSWYSGIKWGIALAFLLPIGRIIEKYFLWEPSISLLIILVNAAIRMCVLTGIAFMVNHVVSLTREIKVLKGILPTCSACKKIRDPSGQWQEMETYISKHSDAHFSHGICDECKRRLYPELFKKTGTG